MTTYTSFAQVADAFTKLGTRLFSGGLSKPYPKHISAVYAALYEVAEDARRSFSWRGIGRKIWGPQTLAAMKGKQSNLDQYVYPTGVSGSKAQFRVGIEAKGIPAMMEMGGRTKPHAIYPWRKGGTWQASRKLGLAELGRWSVRRGRKTLVGAGALKLKGGEFVRYVKNQSAQIPKTPTIRPLLEAAEGKFAEYVDHAIHAQAVEVIDGRAA